MMTISSGDALGALDAGLVGRRRVGLEQLAQDAGGVGVRLDVVGRRVEEALRVALGVVRAGRARSAAVLERLLVVLERQLGVLGEPLQGLVQPQALGQGDPRLDPGRRVEHGGERVGGRHLALHRVEAGLQAGGVRVGVGDLDERLGALDDVLGLQRRGDVGGGLAGLDLDDDLALARAGVVGRARGREGVLQLVDAAHGEVPRRRRARPTTISRARTTARPPLPRLLLRRRRRGGRVSSSDHTDRSVMSRLSRRPAPPAPAHPHSSGRPVQRPVCRARRAGLVPRRTPSRRPARLAR